MTVPVLHEADRVEVTALVDNYTDMLILPQAGVDKRLSLDPCRPLLAGHGLNLPQLDAEALLKAVGTTYMF